MAKSLVVAFLLVIVAVDLGCAWRRRRAGSAGTLNNDVRFQQGQGMNKFRESRKPAENKLEGEAKAAYDMQMNDERKYNEFYRPDSFVEDDDVYEQ